MDRLLAPHRKAQVVGDVNIHEICERVRALVLIEHPMGLTITRDYDTSLPDFRGDREQLIQMVLNIVQNAAGTLPCIVYGEDGVTVDKNAPLYELLHDMPNMDDTAPEFWSMAAMW